MNSVERLRSEPQASHDLPVAKSMGVTLVHKVAQWAAERVAIYRANGLIDGTTQTAVGGEHLEVTVWDEATTIVLETPSWFNTQYDVTTVMIDPNGKNPDERLSGTRQSFPNDSDEIPGDPYALSAFATVATVIRAARVQRKN